MASITTVIPVYNGEKYILQTLDSLARQSRRPDRVVVVDDGSKDQTEAIVRSFREIHCEWAPNNRNLGLFPNHNGALRFAAETQFFHILHANDLVAPEFFARLVPLIENTSGFAIAYCGHVFIRENGDRTQQRGGISGSTPRRLSLREFLGSQSELKAIQLHSAVLKSDFKPLPVTFRLDLPQSADVVFHSEFAARCSEIWADPMILSLVRIHEGSASSQNSRSMKAWVFDEWTTMKAVHELMLAKGAARPGDLQLLKLRFAARCQVKVNMVKAHDPAYAREIRREAVERTGAMAWKFGQFAVAVRDALFPAPNAYSEVISGKSKRNEEI